MKYFIIILIIFGSCNPEKKITRQDEAAIQRVTAKRDLISRVVPIVRYLYPCINDTLIKRDTSIQYDTSYRVITHNDILTKNDTIVKTVFIKKNIHDIRTIIDKEGLSRATDSINSLHIQIANMNGQIIAANGATKQANDLAKNRLWILIGIFVLIVAGAGWKIYTMPKNILR